MLRSIGVLSRKKIIFGAINLGGLFLAQMIAILCFFYVVAELSYDRHFAESDRIYRIAASYSLSGAETIQTAEAPYIAGDVLPENLDAILEHSSRLYAADINIRSGPELMDTSAFAVEADFFEIFEMQFLAGSPSQALALPNSAVLSESGVRQYLPDVRSFQEALGEVLIINDDSYEVTAVISDIPDNTHFQADIFLPFEAIVGNFPNFLKRNWSIAILYHYVKTAEGVAQSDLETGLESILQSQVPLSQFGDNAESVESVFALDVQPLESIHLHSDRSEELMQNGSLAFVFGFAMVAIGVLLLAGVNYINLATAMNLGQLKDMAIKRTLGASRVDLVRTMLWHSVRTTLIAGLSAWCASLVLMEVMANLLDTVIPNDIPMALYTLVMVLILSPVLGSMAGLYPAFAMTSFRPVEILSGAQHRRQGRWLREMLMVVQFSISIFLMIMTFIVFLQTQYVQTIRPGFSSDNVVNVSFEHYDTPPQSFIDFRERLVSLPGIKSAGYSQHPPLYSYDETAIRAWLSETGEQQSVRVNPFVIGPRFLDTYSVNLLAGQGYDANATYQRNSLNGSTSPGPVLLNSMAMDELGISDNSGVIGQILVTEERGEITQYEIVGIVSNFNFRSATEPDQPTIFLLYDHPDVFRTLSVSLQGDTQSALEALEGELEQWTGEAAPAITFVDDMYRSYYLASERQGFLFMIMSGLALMIALIGVAGLSEFSAQERQHEMGIRRALGSSRLQIANLLGRQFVWPLVLALILSCGMAAWAGHQLLAQYAVSINLGLAPFVISAIVVTGVTVLTSVSIVWRVASMPPYQSIKRS